MIPVFFDEVNQIAYVKQEDGEYGWASVHPKESSDPSDTINESRSEHSSSDEKIDVSPDKAKKRRKKAGREKDVNEKNPDSSSIDKSTRLIVGGLMLAVVCLILIYSSGIFSGKGKNPSDAPAASGDSAEINLAEKAAAESYNVLIVKHNIFRGNRITEDDLAVCEISKAEYASCGGAYTSDCTSAVVGLEATKFLPFGSILTFDSCSFRTNYSESPWGKVTEGQEYLDVPYSISVNDLYDWIPGEMVSLSLNVDTTKSQRSDSDTNEIDGMEHSSAVSASTTTDSFKFSSIQIADLLNANGDSIFQLYANLYSVPIGFIPNIMQEEYDEKTIEDFIPCYIRFVVTNEQRKAIGPLSEESVKVELKHLGDPEPSSLPVQNYYALTEYISNAVESRYNEIEKAKKEEGK